MIVVYCSDVIFSSHCEKFVELSAEKNDHHTAVKPEHKKDDSRKASVNIGSIREEDRVERIEIGEQNPSCSGYDSSGEMLEELSAEEVSVSSHGVIKEREEECEEHEEELNSVAEDSAEASYNVKSRRKHVKYLFTEKKNQDKRNDQSDKRRCVYQRDKDASDGVFVLV